MTVITRFAPSPTGYLHIGGARTALFNWLFSRHHGGKFLLRVEDTDRKRSTQEAIDAILNGLSWLGLDWDGEPFFQSRAEARHREVAEALVKKGEAYHCYCSPQELAEMREKAQKENTPFRYDGRWRDRDPAEAPKDMKPTVRLKSPLQGDTVIEDSILGAIRVPNADLDDMILLRSDGTPTYMLAVVVDDRDMGVTHIIRGADHLTNASRQALIYQAMGWEIPRFAHIPLIHGPDGSKLSKRHGALGVEAYRDMGYLPEAMRNYLLRLGWSHGDDEMIATERAIEWFGLENVGKSPARFDLAKLDNINGYYMRQRDNESLFTLIEPALKPDAAGKARLLQGMNGLKERAKTIKELAESAAFYVRKIPLPFNDEARKLLDGGGKEIALRVVSILESVENWDAATLQAAVDAHARVHGLKLGKVAQPLRAALTGSNVSPGIFEVMEILGRQETVARLKVIG